MASLLTLDIIPGYTRPVITIKDGTTCLFDTGADTPVWTQGSERLEYTFGAEKIDEKYFLLSGFGKEPEIADVCVAHDIALQGIGKDGMDDEIIFRPRWGQVPLTHCAHRRSVCLSGIGCAG